MRRYRVVIDGAAFTIDVEETAADRFVVTVGDRTLEAVLESAADLPGAVVTPGMPGAVVTPGVPAQGPADAPGILVPAVRATRPDGPPPRPVRPDEPVARPVQPGPDALTVRAPMPGVVLEVRVANGTRVSRGDSLLVLEAMKMRNAIRAPRDGVVTDLAAEDGRPVAAGEPLLRLAPQG